MRDSPCCCQPLVVVVVAVVIGCTATPAPPLRAVFMRACCCSSSKRGGDDKPKESDGVAAMKVRHAVVFKEAWGGLSGGDVDGGDGMGEWRGAGRF